MADDTSVPWNPKQVAKTWRERPEEPIAIATALSRQGMPDALVEETVRRIVRWREQHGLATDLDVCLVGQALELRDWQDSDAELQGVFPRYLRPRAPRETIRPKYDF